MSSSQNVLGLPVSILDTDLYKLTMQQAVLRYFPKVQSTYRFTHRDKDRYFSLACFQKFQASVARFSDLALKAKERLWLKDTCPYLTTDYLDFLAAFRFKPDQVRITFDSVTFDGECGNINIEATGPWVETILWEVPLMACLSEIYFRTTLTDWDYHGQAESAYQKATTLLTAGCVFSEFGTRRRRSFFIQDLVVQTLVRAAKDMSGLGTFSGTSNVHLAMKYYVAPIGTIAHEWFMGVASLMGYENAHIVALDLWEALYGRVLLIALTDTFSSEAFFKDFVKDPNRARRWKGLRQDSGDPLAFAPRVKAVYESMGIDHRDKTIIFSDALNLTKVLALKQQCDQLEFSAEFGIGTFLTNDFYTLSSNGTEKSRALNMVIKLASVDGRPCVKLSDDLDKNTGDPETVQKVKKIFGSSS